MSQPSVWTKNAVLPNFIISHYYQVIQRVGFNEELTLNSLISAMREVRTKISDTHIINTYYKLKIMIEKIMRGAELTIELWFDCSRQESDANRQVWHAREFQLGPHVTVSYNFDICLLIDITIVWQTLNSPAESLLLRVASTDGVGSLLSEQ